MQPGDRAREAPRSTHLPLAAMGIVMFLFLVPTVAAVAPSDLPGPVAGKSNRSNASVDGAADSVGDAEPVLGSARSNASVDGAADFVDDAEPVPVRGANSSVVNRGAVSHRNATVNHTAAPGADARTAFGPTERNPTGRGHDHHHAPGRAQGHTHNATGHHTTIPDENTTSGPSGTPTENSTVGPGANATDDHDSEPAGGNDSSPAYRDANATIEDAASGSEDEDGLVGHPAAGPSLPSLPTVLPPPHVDLAVAAPTTPPDVDHRGSDREPAIVADAAGEDAGASQAAGKQNQSSGSPTVPVHDAQTASVPAQGALVGLLAVVAVAAALAGRFPSLGRPPA